MNYSQEKYKFYFKPNIISEKKYNEPELIFEEMKEIGQMDQESVWLLYLNHHNQIIGKEMLFLGSTNQCIVDKKIVAHRMIINKSSKIIICHNHPSGDNKPSENDIETTRQIKLICDLLEIPLLDHVIITSTFYSMRHNLDFDFNKK
jgi:DNA repair protein RadC